MLSCLEDADGYFNITYRKKSGKIQRKVNVSVSLETKNSGCAKFLALFVSVIPTSTTSQLTACLVSPFYRKNVTKLRIIPKLK